MQLEDADDLRALLAGSGVSMESVAFYVGVSQQALSLRLRRPSLSPMEMRPILDAARDIIAHRLEEIDDALAGLPAGETEEDAELIEVTT